MNTVRFIRSLIWEVPFLFFFLAHNWHTVQTSVSRAVIISYQALCQYEPLLASYAKDCLFALHSQIFTP